MPEEDVSVSTVDDASDRPRKLNEFKPTNVPLSADEIAQDEAKDPGHEGWAPRTTENIGDLVPLPERDPKR
jgi:hypothetical protein